MRSPEIDPRLEGVYRCFQECVQDSNDIEQVGECTRKCDITRVIHKQDK